MNRILTLLLAAAGFVLASCECCKSGKTDSCCASGKGGGACCAEGKGGGSCCAEPGKGDAHQH